MKMSYKQILLENVHKSKFFQFSTQKTLFYIFDIDILSSVIMLWMKVIVKKQKLPEWWFLLKS